MSKISALVLSFYVALVLYSNVFFVTKLTVAEGSSELFWNHLGILVILLVPAYFLMNKLVTPRYARGAMVHIKTLLLSAALLGLIISIFYHIIPLEPVYDLPAQVDRLFASDMAFTVWLIVPLLALFI